MNVKQNDEKRVMNLQLKTAMPIIEELKKLVEETEVTTKQFYPIFEKMVDWNKDLRTQWVKMLALSKQIVLKLVQEKGEK
jgi:hypothetical protein